MRWRIMLLRQLASKEGREMAEAKGRERRRRRMVRDMMRGRDEC